MGEDILQHELGNRLTVLAQPMDHVASAAMAIMLPGGARYDGDATAGAASVLAEWVFRGAGEMTSRQLDERLDALGCHHGESVRSETLIFSATQLQRNLPEVMEILAEVIRRPALADATFDPARSLVAQDLESLSDEPARLVNLLLREKFYPHPLGRCVYGRADTLEALTPEFCREHWQQRLDPSQAVLAVAGKLDWDALVDRTERLFGDMPGLDARAVSTDPPAGGATHVQRDSAQTHLALAWRSVTADHEHYYPLRLAEAILSGGMSSRLFTEVREKRGLAYHVGCSYHSLRDHAGMFVYAGTRPELAQQTLEVTVAELRRLGEGIDADELARAKVQLTSSLVMQGESTGARAWAIVSDHHRLGRVRTLREIRDAIDAVTVEQVLAALADVPPRDFTVLAIGPDPLDTSCCE